MFHILPSIRESLTSVLPIAIIVLILSMICLPLDAGVLVLFLFGTISLILGMSFFTVGTGISMEPLGDSIGKKLIKELENINIRVNFQCVGFGTAPTEMMNILAWEIMIRILLSV